MVRVRRLLVTLMMCSCFAAASFAAVEDQSVFEVLAVLPGGSTVDSYSIYVQDLTSENPMTVSGSSTEFDLGSGSEFLTASDLFQVVLTVSGQRAYTVDVEFGPFAGSREDKSIAEFGYKITWTDACVKTDGKTPEEYKITHFNDSETNLTQIEFPKVSSDPDAKETAPKSVSTCYSKTSNDEVTYTTKYMMELDSESYAGMAYGVYTMDVTVTMKGE